jgi:ABC-type lipoprotein release transport system permease subunit
MRWDERMGPIWAWSRRELLRHRRAALALILLVGVSGGVVLTAAAGARRSASAFDRFLDASHTADAQLQYASEDDVDEAVLAAVRADPAVERAVPLFITVGFSEASDYDLAVFAGPDPALYSEIDVPRILEGRRPDPAEPHEVLVNRFTQENLGVKVGDTVTIGTFTAEQFGAEDLFEDPAGPEIPLEVVGIAVTAYDLADPEFSGFYGTPAFHEEYWGAVGGFGPTLQIAGTSERAVGDAIERVTSDFTLDEVFVSYASYQAAKVEDGTRVLAVGLTAFALVAGLAALVACAQALHRRMAEASDDLPALRSLGLDRRDCAGAVLVSVLPVIAAGAVLASILAVAGSVLMPIGQARRAEPDPGIDVDPLVLGVGAVLVVLVLTATALVGALRTTKAGLAGPALRARRPGASLLASGRFAPSSQLGVAMALDPGEGRTSVPVRSAIVGAAFGVAGVIGAVTFGSGLDTLVEDPASSGWNWTLAPDVPAEELDALRDVDGVEDIGVVRFAQVEAGGERMTAVAMQAEMGTPSFTVVSGRMPAGPSEAALGPKTAERLGLGIGDPIDLVDPDASGGARDAVVVGEVLMPTSDDNAFNQGIALTPDTLEAVARTDGFGQSVVRFADGVDEEEAAERIREVAPEAVSVYSYSSLPPDVANLEEVQFLPRVLGLFLGLLAVAAVGHALATSVRRRRHDIGIVRSLGFVARDVLRALATQSWTLVVFGLIVGIPLGIALGRVSWQLVADQIGVAPSAATSPLVLLSVALLACVAAAVLSVPPGIAATRQRAVDALRVE